ncbi:store-operated calcium entry-associated regulatory factor isoform 4-T4 [Mergus octosetaceus]
MAVGGAGTALLLLLLSAATGSARGWAQPDRVLLREVQALTLHRGQYTTSRRTAAVPQLQCTGGSAGCSRVPEVVQCYNKGWDGYDVQWQCKADLENTYRFGQIEVSCEGYDYPDDPYILRGSCSLLFRLELTEEGERKVKNSDSFGSGFYQSRKDSSDSGAGAIVIIVILVLAFGVYKFFLSNQQPQQTFGDGDGFARPSWQNHQAPPPPGFKPSFTEHSHDHISVCGQIPQLHLQCMGSRVTLRKVAVQEQEPLLALGAQNEDEILDVTTSKLFN